MRSPQLLAAAAVLFALPAASVSAEAPPDRALTIYNQNFAVVRQTVPLNLTAGLNHVTLNNITYHLEPDSVVLRDPADKRLLKIREQNYRADPISQDYLLSLNEGKTIDFQVTRGEQTSIVQGKIVRSGYVPHTDAYSTFGSQYQYQQQSYSSGGASGQPIIEVAGKLQFSLPGLPLFPALPDDSVLKPTLDWQIVTDKSGPVNAELAYVTGGMTWKAAYNVVFPEVGDLIDLTAWVTMDNESGKTFENARIKLMAGDVSKIQNQTITSYDEMREKSQPNAYAAPTVTEKTFDEYHLYTLANPATLRDREIKQVEFARAARVPSTVIYVYDGLQLDPNQYNGWGYDNIRSTPSYGTLSNRKVFAMREFVNSKANGLGIPLPKGRMRFYRRDADGQLEFVGENDIDHTPKDETVRVYTGNAFDLTGDRVQTNFTVDNSARTADESFKITVHNHKTVPTEIRVVEHLYRGLTWTISAKTNTFLKTDARTIEFRVTLPPDTDKTISYTAHYTW